MNNGKGMYKSPEDIRDFVVSAPINTQLPESYIIPYLPKVKNQGKINSCCAHVASTILEYHSNGVDLSTDFIYGAEQPVCKENGPGMYPRNACKIMQQYGDALYKDCPTNTEIPTCNEKAKEVFDNEEKLKTAAAFKIDSYYRCHSEKDIKYAIMTYGPVLGGITWRENYSLTPNGVISFSGASDGGHAITVIGWNKEGFIIQNSWGKSFGVNGRFTLPYEYEFIEAWAIIDTSKHVDTTALKKSCKKPFAKIRNKIKNKKNK